MRAGLPDKDGAFVPSCLGHTNFDATIGEVAFMPTLGDWFWGRTAGGTPASVVCKWSSTTARQRAASPVTPRASEEGGGTYRAREYEVRRRLIDLPLLFPFPFPKATNPSTDTATR